MNLTTPTASITLNNNSTSTIVESWFIPVDILAILYLSLTILLALILLLIIILDKTSHNVPMILTGNICLTGLICASVHLSLSSFALHNDLNQIQYPSLFCFITGYLSYASAALHNYSYVSSAIHRYMSIAHPARLFWQTSEAQLCLIGIAWILAFVLPLVIVFTNTMIYNVDNQICQVPFRFSLIVFYAPFFIYIIPLNLVIFIYMKLVRFIRGMSQHITPVNTLTRARRDLKIVRRIVITIHILLISGFPLSLFIFLSIGNLTPKYHFRIGFIFVDASMLLVMIALFQFTDSLKAYVRKLIYDRPNMVMPVMR